MPGIGELIDGAMQQAAQAGRQVKGSAGMQRWSSRPGGRPAHHRRPKAITMPAPRRRAGFLQCGFAHRLRRAHPAR
jgi:hypothetical protein